MTAGKTGNICSGCGFSALRVTIKKRKQVHDLEVKNLKAKQILLDLKFQLAKINWYENGIGNDSAVSHSFPLTDSERTTLTNKWHSTKMPFRWLYTCNSFHVETAIGGFELT